MYTFYLCYYSNGKKKIMYLNTLKKKIMETVEVTILVIE